MSGVMNNAELAPAQNSPKLQDERGWPARPDQFCGNRFSRMKLTRCVRRMMRNQMTVQKISESCLLERLRIKGSYRIMGNMAF